MRFKKWYLLPFILIALFIISRMKFLKFRQSEEQQTQYLIEHGQQTPTFHTYEIDTGHKKPQTIHYVHVGDESKPLMLLVHGSPGSSSAMNIYLADTNLTKVAQLIAIDRPGYGYSNFGKTERSLKTQVQALKPLLEKYSHVPIILMGHSYGGPFIARIAMDFPDLIDGMVVVAGSMAPELEPQQWWAKVLDWWAFRWLLPPALRVSNQEIIPLKHDLEEMLPLWQHITCPVIFFQGEADKLVPMENAAFTKKMLTNSRYVKLKVLPGADHFILWSRQSEIVEAMMALVVP